MSVGLTTLAISSPSAVEPFGHAAGKVAQNTVRASALANYSKEMENPAGVKSQIFTYSGRDADTMPPVWVAKTPNEGVVIGACIAGAAFPGPCAVSR